MHVSSYLEAFLSVYGWMMYNTLYDLLGMTWLVFLPFMKLGITTFIDTIADSGNSYAQFKKGLITFLLMVAALVLALVPLDRITVKNATINSVCQITTKIENSHNTLKDNYRFDIDEGGKVPLLPSLVMRIAAGFNNAIYETLPCATDVNKFSAVMQISEITDPELQKRADSFHEQCAIPARNRLLEFQKKAPKTYGKVLEQFKIDDGYTDEKEIRFVNSKLYKLMMQPDMGSISGMIDPEEKNDVEQILQSGTAQGDPLYSDGRVTNVESDNPDNSKMQQATNSGTSSCLKWWEEDLYPALKTKVTEDAAFRLATGTRDYFSTACINTQVINDMNDSQPIDQEALKNIYNKSACINSAVNKYGDKFHDDLVYTATTNVNNSSGLRLNRPDREAMATVSTLGIVGAVLSVFSGGNNVLSAIADSALSFYASMFFYRVMLQMLQPMLLMGIFCFWGIYLVVADYRWETILKGLILIFIISMLPSLWAITQYLDSALWNALYPNLENLSTAMRRSSQNYVERLLLDAASTVFNVIFPLILMYLVTEAGGAKASQAYSASDTRAEQIGRTGGNMTGGSASGVSRDAKNSMDRLRNWRNQRNNNRNLPPGGSKY